MRLGVHIPGGIAYCLIVRIDLFHRAEEVVQAVHFFRLVRAEQRLLVRDGHALIVRLEEDLCKAKLRRNGEVADKACHTVPVRE